MKKKVIIYTAIFGGYDELVEPDYIPEDCDFVSGQPTVEEFNDEATAKARAIELGYVFEEEV